MLVHRPNQALGVAVPSCAEEEQWSESAAVWAVQCHPEGAGWLSTLDRPCPVCVAGFPHVEGRSEGEVSSHVHTVPLSLVDPVPVRPTGWWGLQMWTQMRAWLWDPRRMCHYLWGGRS